MFVWKCLGGLLIASDCLPHHRYAGEEPGGVLEWEWQRLGARTCCVQGKKLLINGVPVIFKGVNRHEHDEHTGKCVSGIVLYRVPRMASACMHDCT